uniref:Uncharacterized protein n=1 Tax=Oxyrrhis marina TaxID=2969 RepID=A0A7S4GMA5_OXYMA|mmetsp:Transcript_54903/g.146881  ORF Transcript_54903/g.146881 Transcript_54903/m.146881 type:complete len:486 (+) Transcript_54903:113-1570(+)
MRVSLTFVAASSVAGLSLRAGREGDVNVADTAAEIWIPIAPTAGETYYYSPAQGRSVTTLPEGATITKVPLELLHGSSELVLHGSNTTTTAHPTLVPLVDRKSCVPHCAWKCTEPACEQNCKPDCGVPSCQTQCPKNKAGALTSCKVRCGEPNCAMYCPPDPCQGRKTLDCVTPKCTTHCAKPKCSVDCGGTDFGCKTVCPTPACQWKCAKPSCPKPKCSMLCEAPPKCDLTMSVPPPGADEQVMAKRDAHMGKPEWKTSLWGACSTQCGVGTQQRKVACSAGDESYCSEKKPATEKSCEEIIHCQYKVGTWSACSSKCGKGKRTRSVECTGVQCLGDKPETEEECLGHAATCDECSVTLYGGKKFSGWTMEFEVGNYTAPELEYRGVKCDDISSLEVIGDYCKLEAFEFGDFNKEHPGWKAEFQMGKYDAADFAPKGAKNDDISSFKLMRVPREDEVEVAAPTLFPTFAPPSNTSFPRLKGIGK